MLTIAKTALDTDVVHPIHLGPLGGYLVLSKPDIDTQVKALGRNADSCVNIDTSLVNVVAVSSSYVTAKPTIQQRRARKQPRKSGTKRVESERNALLRGWVTNLIESNEVKR